MQTWQVFWRFLCLGCYSFGGPAAHIGYFKRSLVDRHGWLNEQSFMQKVALTQWLPGPGSSQLGFAIGLEQAGLRGGLAAFLGFTLPSFVLMLGLALSATWLLETTWFAGVVQALKLLAVVVVADAVYSMFRSFCRQLWQIVVMASALLLLILWPGFWLQMLLLSLAAVLGLWINHQTETTDQHSVNLLTTVKLAPLLLFALLLALSFGFYQAAQPVPMTAGFYQSGALVFGGGHVVLPLLQATVAAPLSAEQFLTGYAAAQAVPGPMFTLATYLGAELWPASPWLGALLATSAIFLPGFLLVLACQHWLQAELSEGPLGGAIQGVNAAVVGLLAAAFYHPVMSSAISAPTDALWAVLGVLVLRWLKPPIICLVLAFVLLGLLWY